MELHLGKMTTQELINWFNISYSYFRQNSKNFYNKLKTYCDYEKKHGYIIVKQIYISKYIKNLDTKIHKVYYDEIVECIQTQDGLSSISGMLRKYYEEPGINRKTLTESRNVLFGQGKDNFKSDNKDFFAKTKGLIGEREYCWGIKIDEQNHYRLLTQDEYDIFKMLLGKHGTPEEVLKLKTLDNMFRNDEITKEEYFDIKDKQSYFVSALSSFKNMTGYQLVHCTKHEIVKNPNLTKEEKELVKQIMGKKPIPQDENED